MYNTLSKQTGPSDSLNGFKVNLQFKATGICLCMQCIHWDNLCVGPLRMCWTNLCFAILKTYCRHWFYVGVLAFIVSLSYLSALQKLPWEMRKHLCCQFCKDLPKWKNENIREVVSFWRQPIRKCICRMLFLLENNKKAIATGICDRTKDEEAEAFKPLSLCWWEGEEIRKHFALYG